MQVCLPGFAEGYEDLPWRGAFIETYPADETASQPTIFIKVPPDTSFTDEPEGFTVVDAADFWANNPGYAEGWEDLQGLFPLGWEMAGTFPWSPTYGELRKSGEIDAHHIVQDAAVRDLEGYNRYNAPAIQLVGPSAQIGTPHYAATQIQRQPGGGSYADELSIARQSLVCAGLSLEAVAEAIARADLYFQHLGVAATTATRIPGIRASE